METENEELQSLTEKEIESISLFKAYLLNVAKFRSKGTVSAAARARKDASLLTKLLKTIRKELQEAKTQAVAAKKAQKV
jgi:uncharacterized protein YjgD (DUF1641 family)